VILGLGAGLESSLPPSTDLANYVKCVSGAFHNLAGTLYQDGKYAAAARFLREGCTLGGRALSMNGAECETEIEAKAKSKPENDAGWMLLKEQLFRRWELLGICYMKIGDRRVSSSSNFCACVLFSLTVQCLFGLQPAYDAFIQSVKAYPFQDIAVGTGGIMGLFGSSQSFQQIAAVIDRATYIGACELLMKPSEVSLKRTLEACSFDASVVGAILERQIENLEGGGGGIMRKECAREAVKALLVDASDVYSAVDMPVRRARLLIRCLKFAYMFGTALGRHADDIGDELKELLTRTVGFLLGDCVLLSRH
jgi:separase